MVNFGSIRCGCGQVTLYLPNPRPKFRCGCCCSDCLQRAYVGAHGQPPKAVLERREPIDLIYVDSLFLLPDEATRAQLGVFRLNDPNGANISLRAECCGAVLCTENQAFHVPHSMAAFNNLEPTVICEFVDVPEVAFHIFTADWPERFTLRLADRETSELGVARAQIAHPLSELDNPYVADLVRSFQIPPPSTSTDFISFKALREDLPIELVHDYFDASRAHDVIQKESKA